MKKIIVIASVLLMNLVIYAQEKFTEGILISKQTIFTDNDQLNSQFEAAGEMKSITFIKDSNSRVELSNPLSGDITTITNKEQMLMLMDAPGLGKKYNIQKLELNEEALKSINLVKGTETKTVLGYVCNQYTVTVNQNGVEMEMELFTTDKIPNVVSQQTAILGDKLEGFPLFMILKMNQFGTEMTITNEVTEIKSEPISDDRFDMSIPNGYEKLQGQ